jgi:hypothetical protein
MRDPTPFHYTFPARDLQFELRIPSCIESVAVVYKIYSLSACIPKGSDEAVSTKVRDIERLARDDGLDLLEML